MDLVFVDTAAWIAILDTSDAHHQQANFIFDELQSSANRLITTEFVLLELGDGFSAIGKRQQALNFVAALRASEIVAIIPATQELVERAWELYADRDDKQWQITDCISFVVMRDEGITTAFTTDRHFVQAGFTKLL